MDRRCIDVLLHSNCRSRLRYHERLAGYHPFAQMYRNMHRWAAHLMVMFVMLHMSRVFYTGSYKGERKFNWVIGVILMVLTLLLSFTGYLLPWDQLAFWAITVGSENCRLCTKLTWLPV